MTWHQRHRLRSFIHSSLWIAPFVGMVVALLVAPAVRALDTATRWPLFGFGPEGARAVLGALTASLFTMMVFVFSVLLLTVQIASAQLTPRVIAFVLHNQRAKVCLFVFAFVYGLAALGRIENAAPQLPARGRRTATRSSISGKARWARCASTTTSIASSTSPTAGRVRRSMLTCRT